jgi:uncharacterized membrane protein YhhN
MISHFLIRESAGWTSLFFILVLVAVASQLKKASLTRSVPGAVLHLLKAAPALFLAALSWYLEGPLLLTAGLVLCALGDIFLDIPPAKAPWGFKVGAIAFALALVCLSIIYWEKPFQHHLLWPLCLTNTFIAIFVLRWAIPNVPANLRILEICYFGFLIVSNIIASTSSVPVFLGSSLWLISDLSIGLSENVVGANKKVNSLDTLGLYDLGLYCIAIGFLNS